MPCGCNFRGAGGRSDQCLVKSTVNKTFKSRFKKQSLISKFQLDVAENHKARLEKSVLVDCRTSSGMADERKVWLQTRSVIRSCMVNQS